MSENNKKVNTEIVGFVKPWNLIDYSSMLFDWLDAVHKSKEVHQVIDCQTKRLLSGK